MADELKIKYPMLNIVFSIPLAPIILQKLVNEIVQFQKANMSISILTNVDNNLRVATTSIMFCLC